MSPSHLLTFALLLFSRLTSRTVKASLSMTDLTPANATASLSATGSSSPYTKIQCNALAKALPRKVSIPSDPTYQNSKTAYFSQQEAQLSPGCIVTPLNTHDVATAVNVLASVYESSHGSAQFAVKGGGHTAFAGSASIQGGAVIDMKAINTVTVNADETVTSVGAGAKWSDVYTYLDSKNLAVSGGRAAQVGVGGLTLGGWSTTQDGPRCLCRYLTGSRWPLILLSSKRLCLRQRRELPGGTRGWQCC